MSKTDRSHSIAIKNRFVQAVEAISKEHYPNKREVDIIKSLGFSPPNFYRMKISGSSYPTLDNCFLLCNQYDISEEWLLSGKATMKSINEAKSAIEVLKLITLKIESDYENILQKK